MQNDPELDGKYLGGISSDFIKISKILQEASYQLRVRKISKYPIFIISKQAVSLGQLLLRPEEKGLNWFYYFSFMEEFLGRKIIKEQSLFEGTYKNPDEFCCLFVLDDEKEFTNFVFIPYPEEE